MRTASPARCSAPESTARCPAAGRARPATAAGLLESDDPQRPTGPARCPSWSVIPWPGRPAPSRRVRFSNGCHRQGPDRPLPSAAAGRSGRPARTPRDSAPASQPSTAESEPRAACGRAAEGRGCLQRSRPERPLELPAVANRSAGTFASACRPPRSSAGGIVGPDRTEARHRIHRVPRHDGLRGRAGERRLARQHLVQHAAQRVDVASARRARARPIACSGLM